jgi:CO/xanthine dehydrogenase Mo-binding subunit
MLTNRHPVTGHRLPRLDGPAKVTGKHTYGSDFALPGMLHGKILRSDVTHAKIKRIDVRGALAVPGVRAVITGKDISQNRYGPSIKDTCVFAVDRVRFIGEPIAAVAAVSVEIAEQALSAIIVELEPLSAVYDLDSALANEAPIIHPEWKSYAAAQFAGREANVASRSRIKHGDVDVAFQQSFRVYEHFFTTPLVHAGYTEPRVAVASWESDDSLTVWSSAQLPFEVQSTLSEILELESSKIRVIVPGIGGGFGGKLRIGVEHFAALLARTADRPVRIITTCEEELIAAHPRQAAAITIKTGVTRDGLLLARQGHVALDCGAYAGTGPRNAAMALLVLIGPYKTPNIQVEGVAVYTNKVPSGSFRAPAGPMANFAVECQMDMIAEDLGIDPLELRLRNIVHEGDQGPVGQVLSSVSVEECLRRAADAIGWNDRRPASGRGKGIACSWWMTLGGSSGVFIKLNPDGTIALNSGAVELGTGALTGVAQILAEEFSLELSDIRITAVDTQTAPYDYGAQGSRTTVWVGNACRAAAETLRNAIFSFAESQLGIPARQMALRDKCVVAGDKKITLAELARLSASSGGGLIAHGTAVSTPVPHDSSRVENHPLPAWNAPSYHAHAADVSVDTETGDVTINRYVVAQDVGYAINPTYIEGQIEGGVAQGIGQALSEEIVCRDGRVMNSNLTDYKMPTSLDMPPVESILIECPSAEGPLGAKGVGEPPCICPPAAISNALAAATGLWITSLPITAEKIALGLRGGREDIVRIEQIPNKSLQAC